MNRLAFLHSAFAGAVAAALKTSRPPLQPGRTQQACAQLHAKVTRALVDQLHAATLRTEKLPARCAPQLQPSSALLSHKGCMCAMPAAMCCSACRHQSYDHACLLQHDSSMPIEQQGQLWQS